MYLWTILKKPKTELVREVFEAQKAFKTKDSWIEQVENDLKSCEIELTMKEIKNLSRYQMTKLVKAKIKIQSEQYLLNLKESHVKTEKLYPSENMKEYLVTEELTTEEKRLLFKLKTFMIQLKGNFSRGQRGNLKCDLCNDVNSEETQMHLLECTFLVNHPELKSDIKSIKYDDIFQNLSSQVKAIKVWKKILSVRKIKGLK